MITLVFMEFMMGKLTEQWCFFIDCLIKGECDEKSEVISQGNFSYTSSTSPLLLPGTEQAGSKAKSFAMYQLSSLLWS